MKNDATAPVLGEAKNTPTSEAYGRKRNEWENDVCSCNTWLHSTCLTYLFCLPCSLLCCIPHQAAAMARKIGWRGYTNSRTAGNKAYTVNRKTLRLFVLVALFATMVVLFLKLYAIPTCVQTVLAEPEPNYDDLRERDPTEPTREQCKPGCYEKWVGNHDCDPECNVEECNFDDDDCKPENIVSNETIQRYRIVRRCGVPYGISIWTINIFIEFIAFVFISYFVLLRYKMRKAFGIKASCCTSYGDVGEFVEDTICMTSCFPCAITQMAEQTDTQLEYCCQGTSPAGLSSSVVSAV